MANLTYRGLLHVLLNATNAELDQNVTVLIGGEYYPIPAVKYAEQDVLDEGHLYLDGDHQSPAPDSTNN